MGPPLLKESIISNSKTKKSALRTAEGAFQAWERRTQMVKSEMAAASAATDAKTARLRALRLAKEAEDARIAAETPPPPAPVKKRTLRSK
ncbi:MAG TPA: hypothetical protein VHY57_02495 [Rhizomicrobium sp.]|nr:hypothetical protein [Rhizomicrobium sp.]